MTVYERLITAVENGVPYSIDLQKRKLKVGGKYVKLDNLGIGKASADEFLKQVEFLYEEYRVSTPSAKSASHREKYFKAIPDEDMTVEQRLNVNAERREVARARLEFYVLAGILNGFNWEENFGQSFFFRKDNLILLKNWFM